MRVIALLLAGSAFASAASAQTAATTGSAPVADMAVAPPAGTKTAEPVDTGGLQEIVVTAQRRSETLTSVPLSISAATGETLEASGIKNLSSLSLTTPAFVASNGVGYTQIFIRGIGNSIYVGADPSVATFIDDVPRIYASLVNNFINVERVEVLKGAQGGLYGRNSTGGVINIITRQPEDKFGLDSRLSYGSRNTLDFATYVNVPLSDAIAANASVTRQSHNGYIKNLATPNPYPAGATIAGVDANSGVRPGPINDQDLWAVDGKLRIKLADNLKVTLAGDYARKHDANGNGWVQTDPATAYGLYLFLADQLGATATVGPFTAPTKKFTSFSPARSAAYITDYGTSARIDLGLPHVDLTSITAIRWNDTFYTNDSGASTVPLVSSNVTNKKRNIYQEIRALSTDTGRLHLLGGATYLHDRANGSINATLLGVVETPITDSTIRTNSWSVYGQAAYDITDALTLTGSLRYIHERKVVGFPPSPETDAVVGRKLLPSATVSYKVGDGTIYARYAKGFKTGGINPVTPPSQFPTSVGSLFKPEQVDTYEIGYRAQLFDRKVQFTSAIFYNDYKDIQVVGNSSNQNFPYVVVNAPKARTYGGEASLTWRVARPLTVSLNGGYLNTKYTDFTIPGGGIVAPLNNTGNRLPYAPRFQGGATVNIDEPLNDRLHAVGSAVFSHLSSFFLDSANIAVGHQDSYSVVNLRAGVATKDDKYGVYVFVNNLFNKFYATYGSSSSPEGYFINPSDPRIIGGTIEVKF